MKKYIILLVVLVVLGVFLVFARYNEPDYPENYKNAVITLDRTQCFGTCPAYSLIIYGNGTVVYEGRAFVEVEGQKVYEISREDVKEIVDIFYEIDYFSLNDEYTESVTDLPTITTSITIDDETKQVIDYYGAPEKLKELEKKIDEIAKTNELIGNGRR